MKRFVLAAVCALSCFLNPAWAGALYDIRAFGAIGDGTNDDTVAIQKALDASGQTNGTVHFPAGIYLSKPLTLRTKTTLDFDQGAILQASPVQSDYLRGGGNWLKARSGGAFTPFISGNNLEDITIQGPGIIDGHGEVWWPEAEKARRKVSGYTLPRPNLIGLNRVKNLLIRDVTLRNSPKFHLVPSDCDGVVISNVTILAPEHAANTDAIDPSSCNNVLITQCTIDVGDDNVAIKAGRRTADREFASENIVVSNCTFRHGHGMSIGSETGGGVRNVLVTHCTFENTENGLRIKSQQGKGGLVENIRYEHISMTNVDPAITFTSYYQNNSAKDVPGAEPYSDQAAPAEGTPVYRDIYIADLNATCPRSAGSITGLPSCCVSNVILENVNITSATGFKISNASGIKLNQVSVKPLNGKAFLLANAQVDGLPVEQK
jgi:polygalacturonase